ncbi:MAG: TIGR03000 domain-containing protein [Gemmataceae bacterium]
MKIRTLPLRTIAMLGLLSWCDAASAGLIFGPYNYSIGPYRGGEQWSYFESYNYYGVSNVSAYPYWAAGVYPYFWESPYTWGSGSHYPSIFGNRPAYYNAINPAYLTPPLAPGYTKAMARDVVLPKMDQENGLAAVIDVKMPCYGELWVDGVATEQLGTDRLFRSPPLEKGSEYVYAVKARWLDGEGKSIEQTQQVRVHCGQRVLLVFPKATPPLPPSP